MLVRYNYVKEILVKNEVILCEFTKEQEILVVPLQTCYGHLQIFQL